jgi:hypothetical protein
VQVKRMFCEPKNYVQFCCYLLGTTFADTVPATLRPHPTHPSTRSSIAQRSYIRLYAAAAAAAAAALQRRPVGPLWRGVHRNASRKGVAKEGVSQTGGLVQLRVTETLGCAMTWFIIHDGWSCRHSTHSRDSVIKKNTQGPRGDGEI